MTMTAHGTIMKGGIAWPSELDDLDDAPDWLYFTGNHDLLDADHKRVAIVGSHAATAYGEHVASELAQALVQQGWVIVSGGAYGIDAAAHRGTLVLNDRTIAVQAGGLDRLYPPGNAKLFDRILTTKGLLLSEEAPMTEPHRELFLARNRIIAALSRAVVVVEAAPRSGSLNCAGHAQRLGRPVFVVPGPITSAVSAGSNALLDQGARPVLSRGHLIEALEELS